MVDVTVKILEPAESFAFMTLAEAKVALGIPATDVSGDEQLQWLIDTNSSVVATLCNRVFAKEKVQETWRDLGDRRLFLTHWPVKEADIESVTTNGVLRDDYELEEGSGKLSIFTDRAEDIVVIYTGGFDLPDECPMALKQATGLLVSTQKSEAAAASLTGVRMISHKESRVMFHNPNQSSSSGAGGASNTQTRATVIALLNHYVRHWI